MRDVSRTLAGLAFAGLLLSVGRIDAHDPALLDPNRATPGIRLTLVPVASPSHSEAASPVYRLEAIGLPRGVTFGVWTKEFTHAFHEVSVGFRVDDTGRLATTPREDGRPRYLDEMVFGPGPYFRGAIWEVALASEDRTIATFTRVIPLPLVARAGPCSVSLELVSHRGERFLASGTGFVPGEVAVVESRAAGRVQRKRLRVSGEGLLPPNVISHVSLDSDRTARYSVKGQICEVALEYRWGEAAFVRY
jgi:hypothetical protein